MHAAQVQTDQSQRSLIGQIVPTDLNRRGHGHKV